MERHPTRYCRVMLGVMAAGRTQSVSALVAWRGLEPHVGGTLGRVAATCSAAGEVIGDKLPWIPDRTAPGPLFGRVIFGAAGGALVERHEGGRGLRGALVGGATAAIATLVLHRTRRWLSRHTPLPAIAWGFAEDAAVAALGVAASRRIED